ncbi:MAG: hypothetical protein LBB10_00275 [Bifidobacteriaceae bacterium]|jgi:hypothetical protein|nr:hypothetical protein [Bifidobacteriaceae bacterium]
MIKGGIGGANTSTGLKFEKRTNLHDFIKSLDGYMVTPNDKKDVTTSRWLIHYKNEEVGEIFKQHGLYRYLDEFEGYNWKKILSKKILPDDGIFVIANNTVYIIEKKYQARAGSVDEKLQTCDFKKKQYKKLFAPLNKDVEYYYLLEKEWFERDEYKDVFDYIISSGCHYYFDYIPFNKLGLPIPEK